VNSFLYVSDVEHILTHYHQPSCFQSLQGLDVKMDRLFLNFSANVLRLCNGLNVWYSVEVFGRNICNTEVFIYNLYSSPKYY
jgi:hypothetical protein